MKDNLTKGQAFIGLDGEKYYFLGFGYDDQILFTNIDLWTDQEQKYIEKNSSFIKEILDEKLDLIESCAWYYQSKKELDSSPIEDKIKRCLDIIDNSNLDDLRVVPTKVDSLVRGQAYSKELNQYYELIGFIVDNDIYIKNDLKSKETGFFAIYHSNCDESVPLIFERSDGIHFLSGNDDIFDIKEILMDKNEINLHLSSALKERLKNEEKEMCK